MATPELAPRLIQADLLVPLDDVLVRNSITDLSSAHDALRKDGNLYGLDMVTVAFGILYNNDRYEEANITPATTPDEWVEVERRPDRSRKPKVWLLRHPPGQRTFRLLVPAGSVVHAL